MLRRTHLRVSDKPIRVVFMGTADFAVPVLAALVEASYDVVGVYTRPDRRAGRGKKLSPTPVKTHALSLGIAVLQPPSLRNTEAQDELESLRPDLIVVAAYGLFLPKRALGLPRHGCLNVHPSLLPAYRGPSPVASAILNGETVTGVTIMQMDEGMDTGPTVGRPRDVHSAARDGRRADRPPLPDGKPTSWSRLCLRGSAAK